jgi:hypothetical protein
MQSFTQQTYLVPTLKEELVWVLTVVRCTAKPGDIVKDHWGKSRVSGQTLVISFALRQQRTSTHQLARDIEGDSDGGNTDHKSQDPGVKGKGEESIDHRLRM